MDTDKYGQVLIQLLKEMAQDDLPNVCIPLYDGKSDGPEGELVACMVVATGVISKEVVHKMYELQEEYKHYQGGGTLQ